MTHDRALPTHPLPAGTTLVPAQAAQTQPVALDSPALDVMTDLTLVKAATIGPTVSLREAEGTMIAQGVRMLFVVSDMPTIVGLMTTTDLSDDKHMRLVEQRGVRYADLVVADVMTPLSWLDAIDLDVMRAATVAGLIATLQAKGRNHLLVAEPSSGTAPRVRGVVSRAQIERQLGTTIDVNEVPPESFARIARQLA
jgi:CBS domain-containing protein